MSRRNHPVSGSSLLEFTLALALSAGVLSALMSLASVQDQRRRVEATGDLVQRAAVAARRMQAERPDGATALTVADLSAYLPGHPLVREGDRIVAMRTPINRPLALVDDGPFAFWLALRNLDRHECRTLLPRLWRLHPRLRLNQNLLKPTVGTPMPAVAVAHCLASGNTLEVEGT